MKLEKVRLRARYAATTAAGLLAAFCLAVESAPGETVKDSREAKRATETIVIDGRLDERSWREADAIALSHVFKGPRLHSLPRTEARFLWDDLNFYIGFRCADDDVWSFSQVNDQPLYKGDVVEVFVRPTTDKLRYYEFVIAPNGAIFDARYPSRGAGLSGRFVPWNSDAAISTTIAGTDGDYEDDDDGYVVEAAIPLSVFAESERPRPGRQWQVGAFRYDYSKSYEDVLMLMSIPRVDPNLGFHDYERYGALRFER